MIVKNIFLTVSIIIFLYPFVALSMFTKEKIQQLEQQESFHLFIKRVKDQCNTAHTVSAIKNNFNPNSFLGSLCNSVISFPLKMQGYDGIDLEDAKIMDRFFENEQNTAMALETFKNQTYDLDDINHTFAKLKKKKERKLAHLIKLEHKNTLKRLGLCSDTKKTKVREKLLEKDTDGNYLVPDEAYLFEITQGLIIEYIFDKNMDVEIKKKN